MEEGHVQGPPWNLLVAINTTVRLNFNIYFFWVKLKGIKYFEIDLSIEFLCDVKFVS